jgi:hypothetical protein
VLILASQPTQRAAHEKHERAGRLDQSQGRIINRNVGSQPQTGRGEGDPLPGKPERGDVLRCQARTLAAEALCDIVGGRRRSRRPKRHRRRPASPAPLDEARILEACRSARRIAQPGVAQRDPVSSCEIGSPGPKTSDESEGGDSNKGSRCKQDPPKGPHAAFLSASCLRSMGRLRNRTPLAANIALARAGRRSRRLARRTRP